MSDTGTTVLTDVRSNHRFDEAALMRFMERHFDCPIDSLVVRQFEGGQSNPTFLLEADGRRLILRKKPPGELLASAHAIDREFRIMQALQHTPVPVPVVHVYCDDAAVIGTEFYLMDYVEGRIFSDLTLPGVPKAERAALFDEMARVSAELHRIDPAAIGLADFAKPGNYMERQIARWTKQYRAAELEPIEAMDKLIAWLPNHIPASSDSDTRIVHGDYQMRNVIFHPTEPRILAVLDWELSTLGHPLADFAYFCIFWRIPAVQGGLAGIDLAEKGLPDMQRYVDTYCRYSGLDSVPGHDFFLAFNMFRLTGILQGVAARAVRGNASSTTAHQSGPLARLLAETAWKLVELLRSDAPAR